MNTRQGERILQPMLGLGIHKYLFEQWTDETQASIDDEIRQTIAFWFPYVILKQVNIQLVDDTQGYGLRNLIKISITFAIIQDPNMNESIAIEFGE